MNEISLQKINSIATETLGQGVDVVHLAEREYANVYLAVDSNDKQGILLVHDSRFNLIFKVNCPYMMRAMLKMAGSGDYDVSVDYIETDVTLREAYNGLEVNSKYIVTDTVELHEPELYQKIQAAIEDGKAECVYNKPVLNLLGLKYTGEVVHRF